MDVTEDVGQRILSLPMYPELKKIEIDRISDLISEFLE